MRIGPIVLVAGREVTVNRDLRSEPRAYGPTENASTSAPVEAARSFAKKARNGQSISCIQDQRLNRHRADSQSEVGQLPICDWRLCCSL